MRLSLQTILDVKEHLTLWWLRAGYHTLTLLFASFTAILLRLQAAHAVGECSDEFLVSVP